MIIEIEAFDTWFFRDGKPFSMGENHWSDSIFPPNMSTVYGAIRGAYFSENMELFYKLKQDDKLNTKDDPSKKLVIKKMMYKINDGYYYNMPLDLVQLKDYPEQSNEERDKHYKVYPLKIKENNIMSSLCLKNLLYFDQQIKTVTDGLLSEISTFEYMDGETDNIKISKISDYLVNEPKVGIGINRETGTSMDSRFYRIDLKRPNKMSLVIDFDGIELENKNGVIKFGGESKFARYQELSGANKPFELTSKPEINNRFKLNLLTPSIFEKGWIPKNIGESYILNNENFKLQLVAASIGKHTLAGGYDMVKNCPKPMLKVVPAGSTYFFEILEGKPKNIIEYFHLKSISDRLREEGYGISIISNWEV